MTYETDPRRTILAVVLATMPDNLEAHYDTILNRAEAYFDECKAADVEIDPFHPDDHTPYSVGVDLWYEGYARYLKLGGAPIDDDTQYEEANWFSEAVGDLIHNPMHAGRSWVEQQQRLAEGDPQELRRERIWADLRAKSPYMTTEKEST